MLYNIFVVFLYRNYYRTQIINQTIMLLEKIGINAGLIWAALEDGELNIKVVKKTTKLSEKDLNLALGWLAREGKVRFNEVEGEQYIGLA